MDEHQGGNYNESDCLINNCEEQPLINSDMKEPTDRKNLVYWSFFFLGITTILPWNFFITSDSYWTEKFKYLNETKNSSGSSNHSQTNLEQIYRSFFALFSQVPLTLCTLYCSVCKDSIKDRRRIYGALLAMSMIFTLTALFSKVNTDEYQVIFFGITMTSVFVINLFSAFFQSSVFAMAAVFPPRYTQSFCSGGGCSGMLSALAFIIAISVTEDPADYALIFFLLATGVILLAIMCLKFLENNPFYKYNQMIQVDERKQLGIEVENSDIPTENKALTSANVHIKLNENKISTENSQGFFEILGKIRYHFFTAYIVFMITLACFPALLASVKPQESLQGTVWAEKYFNPVACFLVFGLGDFLGRTLIGPFSFPSKDNPVSLLLLAVSRGVFIVLFIYCNASPRHHTEPFFVDQIYFIAFNFLLAVTNGYFSSLAVKYAPQFVESQHKEQVGMMMALAITSGLASGAAMSFAVVNWV